MAIKYGFYNSINHDRVYNAEDFADIFNGVINDGVFMSIGDHFSVYPSSGMTVSVAPGRAWFNGTWTENDTNYLVDISEAEIIQTRIDVIALEIDKRNEARRNRIIVLKGQPAATPSKPSLTKTSGLYQYALAYITVKPNTYEITGADIEQAVGMSETPFVTAILQTANLDSLFQNWDTQFKEWFYDVQTQLSGDIATNLQQQINQLKLDKVSVSDKASAEDISAGTANKWVDANGLSFGLSGIKDDLSSAKWNVGDVKQSTKELAIPWMKCEGQALLRSSYPELYPVVKDKYGVTFKSNSIISYDFSANYNLHPGNNTAINSVFTNAEGNNIYFSGTWLGGNGVFKPGSTTVAGSTSVNLFVPHFCIGDTVYAVHTSSSGSSTSTTYYLYVTRGTANAYTATSSYNAGSFQRYSYIINDDAAYILYYNNNAFYILKITNNDVQVISVSNMNTLSTSQFNVILPGKTKFFIGNFANTNNRTNQSMGFIDVATSTYYSTKDSNFTSFLAKYKNMSGLSYNYNPLYASVGRGFTFFSPFMMNVANMSYNKVFKFYEDSSGNFGYKEYTYKGNGTFSSGSFMYWFSDENDDPVYIRHHTTIPYVPTQNNVDTNQGNLYFLYYGSTINGVLEDRSSFIIDSGPYYSYPPSEQTSSSSGGKTYIRQYYGYSVWAYNYIFPSITSHTTVIGIRKPIIPYILINCTTNQRYETSESGTTVYQRYYNDKTGSEKFMAFVPDVAYVSIPNSNHDNGIFEYIKVKGDTP